MGNFPADKNFFNLKVKYRLFHVAMEHILDEHLENNQILQINNDVTVPLLLKKILYFGKEIAVCTTFDQNQTPDDSSATHSSNRS